MSELIRFSILGPVRAWRGDTELPLGTPQQRLVLAVLLLAEGRSVPAAAIIDAVWGQRPPRSALGTVRSYVSRLRNVLGESIVVAMAGDYAMADYELDLTRSARLVTDAGAAVDPVRRRDLLAEAETLWTAEPLAELPGEFAAGQRAVLRERRMTLVEQRLDAELALGHHHEVLAELTALCRRHPFRERLHGNLMLVLHRCGRRSESLAVYAELEARLAEELGIDPAASVTALHDSIARETHRGPVSDIRIPRPAQLPADIGDFTGRSPLAASIQEHLETDHPTSTITLISGFAGVGKTALALHCAHRVRDHYRDGQLYIDLQGTASDRIEPAEALARFLRALGLPDQAIPATVAERSAMFRSMVSDRSLLVLLDNAASAAQLRPLLPGSPSCAVLVTSRGRLTDLVATRRLDLGVWQPEESLDLFARIAGIGRVLDEPAAAEEIVASCGHLPLAVRIAAARLAVRPHWTLESLTQRLADPYRRLDELAAGDCAVAAAFEADCRRLGEQAAAWCRLAVADLCDLDLAEAAALLGTEAGQAEDLLESLVDHGVLESVALRRYRFHPLARIYARQRCEPDTAAQAHTALLRYYCDMPCPAAPGDLPARLRTVYRQPIPVPAAIAAKAAALLTELPGDARSGECRAAVTKPRDSP